MVGNVIVIDNFLENYAGHYYEYDKAIVNELRRRGLNVSLVANENVSQSIRDEIGAIPFFPKENSISRLFRIKMGKFYKKNKEVIQQSTSDTLLFVPQMTYTSLVPLTLSILFSKANFNKLILLYRFSYSAWLSIPPTYWFGITLLKKWIKSGKIVLVTDSALLQNECERTFGISCTVLPIPHTPVADTRLVDKRNELVLYAPGPARINKGLEVLVNTIEAISRSNEKLPVKLVFVLQHDASLKHPEVVTQLIERLALFTNHSSVEVRLLGALSSEAYHRQLQQADIILLPYQAQAGYDSQTSGVFTEAVSIGKPVIVSANTWMAHELATNDIAGEAMESYSPTALQVAIHKIIANLPGYLQKAISVKESWNAFHNPVKFCDMLLALSESNKQIL